MAKYLWDNGFRSMSFEKSVPNSYERLKGLRDAHPTARFVLAVQDRMGWRAPGLSQAADEV